jgi:hypothetical protein
VPALRHLDQHSGPRRGDRKRARGRDARARASRRRQSCQSRRSGASRKGQWQDPWQAEGRDGAGLAVGGGDAVLDECVAGVDEFDRLAGGGARLEVESCAHAGKHKGVAPVGLGEFSCGLGEASGLTGIDLDPGQAGLDERPLEQAMVGPCRLENDSSDIEPFKPFDEGAMAFRIVRDVETLAAGMDRHVENAFRNVDADPFALPFDLIFFSVLVLSRGHDPRVSIQAAGKRERWSNYSTVLSDWGAIRPVPSRPPACVADRRTAPDPAGSDGKTIRQSARACPSAGTIAL